MAMAAANSVSTTPAPAHVPEFRPAAATPESSSSASSTDDGGSNDENGVDDPAKHDLNDDNGVDDPAERRRQRRQRRSTTQRHPAWSSSSSIDDHGDYNSGPSSMTTAVDNSGPSSSAGPGGGDDHGDDGSGTRRPRRLRWQPRSGRRQRRLIPPLPHHERQWPPAPGRHYLVLGPPWSTRVGRCTGPILQDARINVNDGQDIAWLGLERHGEGRGPSS